METAQCPAYRVYDGNRHARQSHTYLQTLSGGSHSAEDAAQAHRLYVPLSDMHKPEPRETFPTGQVHLTKMSKRSSALEMEAV